mmetsp:Transcript_40941/g.67670  ORF Transcript_40941/g.67670 Transcript_40941/m.67670 type:complete len:102 (-) Transcript_40941:11-316(-)
MDDIGAHSESSGEGVLAGELLWRERPKIQRGGKLARARSGKKAQEKMEKKAQEENKIISVPVEGDGLPPGAVQLVLGYQAPSCVALLVRKMTSMLPLRSDE